MRGLAPRSLRGRLFLALSVAVAIAVAVSLAVGAELTRRSVRTEALASLARQAALVAAQEKEQPGSAQEAVGRFLATDQERLAIVTVDQARFLLPAPGSAELARTGSTRGTLSLRGESYLYAAKRAGGSAVVVLRPERYQAADWTRFWLGFVIAGAVGIALAAAFAFLLARAISRPVARVADATTRLARGEHPDPLPPGGAAEVEALSTAFNHLADELAHAQAAERSFLLSVSHELKTPLTAIRGHAEALAEGVVGPADASAVIERESHRLERLVGDLLDLARLRRRAFTARVERLDLVQVAEEVVHRHEQQAQGFGVELSAETTPGAAATGDHDRLLQAVSNLVENALRCTPSGGSVVVRAAPGLVEVRDTGPGIEADERPRAFERFFLFNRYGSTRPVGTGLGLAIVEELARAMRGSVEVESIPGAGSAFRVVLPAAAAAPVPAPVEA